MTGAIILLLDAGMLALAGSLFMAGAIGFDGALVSVVALMSSFGPVIALANLGTGLQSTFAAGNRVLDILDEQPAVREVTDGRDIVFRGADARPRDLRLPRQRDFEGGQPAHSGARHRRHHGAAAAAANPRCSSCSCGSGTRI